MGLFGRASRRSDAGAWAVALHRGANDARGKLDFGDSMTSHETIGTTTSLEAITMDDFASAPAALSDRIDGAERVRRLERRLRLRNATIVRLRETMEAGERVQSERIELLERQLERLVELPSSGREREGRVAGHVLLEPREEGSSRQAQDRLEISALNELLARVIAEKDRLGFENEHLKSLVTQHGCHVCADKMKMPPSIVELDAIMKVENEENSGGRGNCRYGPGPSTPPEELPPVLYKMSCRDRPRLRYMGTCDPAAPADAASKLTRVVRAHCSQVWRMVLEENGGPYPSSPEDDPDFSTSSLARHCVERCKRFSSEEEVMSWFGANVRVEVPGPVRAGAMKGIKAERKERQGKMVPPCEKKRWGKKKKHGKGGKEGKTKVTGSVEI